MRRAFAPNLCSPTLMWKVEQSADNERRRGVGRMLIKCVRFIVLWEGSSAASDQKKKQTKKTLLSRTLRLLVCPGKQKQSRPLGSGGGRHFAGCSRTHQRAHDSHSQMQQPPSPSSWRLELTRRPQGRSALFAGAHPAEETKKKTDLFAAGQCAASGAQCHQRRQRGFPRWWFVVLFPPSSSH